MQGGGGKQALAAELAASTGGGRGLYAACMRCSFCLLTLSRPCCTSPGASESNQRPTCRHSSQLAQGTARPRDMIARAFGQTQEASQVSAAFLCRRAARTACKVTSRTAKSRLASRSRPNISKAKSDRHLHCWTHVPLLATPEFRCAALLPTLGCSQQQQKGRKIDEHVGIAKSRPCSSGAERQGGGVAGFAGRRRSAFRARAAPAAS